MSALLNSRPLHWADDCRGLPSSFQDTGRHSFIWPRPTYTTSSSVCVSGEHRSIILCKQRKQKKNVPGNFSILSRTHFSLIFYNSCPSKTDGNLFWETFFSHKRYLHPDNPLFTTTVFTATVFMVIFPNIAVLLFLLAAAMILQKPLPHTFERRWSIYLCYNVLYPWEPVGSRLAFITSPTLFSLLKAWLCLHLYKDPVIFSFAVKTGMWTPSDKIHFIGARATCFHRIYAQRSGLLWCVCSCLSNSISWKPASKQCM